MSAIYPPGPWTTKGASIQAISHGVRFTIARVANRKLSLEGVVGAARLMSAAPEMLEACKISLANLEPLYASDHLVIRSLRASIAKAELP